ncbi:uncharacterized protein LOC143256549 isoform X2 [Tachypleus tridentatus]
MGGDISQDILALFYSLCQRYLKTFKGPSLLIETRWLFSCSGCMYRRIVKQFKRYVKTATVDRVHTAYDCSDPYGTTKKLADECGFDTDFFALTPQTQVFSSKSQYIQFCESIMPEAIMKRIPSEKLDDFWADWCEMAQKCKVNFKADGTVLREVTMLEMCLISKI